MSAEDDLLKRIEAGDPTLTDEELDAVIKGTTPSGRTPISGAPSKPVTQLQQLNQQGGNPQPTLKEILSQGAIGAGGRLLSYWKGLPGTSDEADRAEHGALIKRMHEELPYSGAGEVVADMALGTALPLSRAPGILQRSLRTGAMLAPAGAVAARGQGGNTLDMARDAAWAGAGGVLGTLGSDVALKGINAARGVWEDPSKKYLRDFARNELGVELRPGDLFPNSIVRGAENLGTKHPYLSGQAEILDAQEKALGKSLFSGGENQFVDALQRAKSHYDDLNRQLWAPVSQAAQSATGVPTQTIRNTLLEIQNTYPNLLNSIKNQPVRDTLNRIVGNGKPNAFAPNLSFDEVRELQQAIGPITAQLKRQALSGSAEQGEATLVNKLYGATHRDLQRWGTDPRNAQAYQLYSDVNETFKKQLLPFYKNPIVTSAEAGEYYHAPEKMLSDLQNKAHQTAREELLYYLSQADHRGTGILETLKTADRAVKSMVRPDPEATGNLGMGALMAPKLFATQLAGAQASEFSKLAPWMGGSPYLGPAALQKAIRGGLGMMGERNLREPGSNK